MIIQCMPSGPLMTNAYLAYDEASKKGFVVDPGGYNPKLTSMVTKEGIDIEYIILTHGHGDHIGGVQEHLMDFPNAKVVAATEEKKLLGDPALNSSADICGHSISLAADIWVNEGDTLKVGDMELKFIMTPGHTTGGMCIVTDDCVFSGDTLFQYSIGRTDFYGGSFEQIVDSIRTKLFALPDGTAVYPGHMGPTTIGAEKKGNPFV